MTLLETLIASFVLLLVIAGVYLLYTTMQTTMSRGELKADLQQNVRVGMERLVQELRMAGYDPSAALRLVVLPPKDAVRAASPTCLSFVTYSVDRSTTPPGEKSVQVTYDHDAKGRLLRRREDPWDSMTLAFKGGSAQPQATTIQLLEFTYYNTWNELLAPAAAPGWTSTHRCPPVSGAQPQPLVQLDFTQLRQVRRVAIRLRGGDSRPGIASEFYTVASDVRLRNR